MVVGLILRAIFYVTLGVFVKNIALALPAKLLHHFDKLVDSLGEVSSGLHGGDHPFLLLQFLFSHYFRKLALEFPNVIAWRGFCLKEFMRTRDTEEVQNLMLCWIDHFAFLFPVDGHSEFSVLLIFILFLISIRDILYHITSLQIEYLSLDIVRLRRLTAAIELLQIETEVAGEESESLTRLEGLYFLSI